MFSNEEYVDVNLSTGFVRVMNIRQLKNISEDTLNVEDQIDVYSVGCTDV